MTDESNRPVRPLIGYITRDNAPQITPAPVSRTWMAKQSEADMGWSSRCVPMLIANQSGWVLRNPCACRCTCYDQDGTDVLIQPDKHDGDQLLPVSHFGNGILSWRLP